jgi:catechol 2,3-dioxygenase-like lactoylglutathione lyase family enzyme
MQHNISGMIIHTNVTINVNDLTKSLDFYQAIGFVLKNRWGNHYAQLTAPGIEIGLHPTDSGNMTKGSGNISIGISIQDVEDGKSLLLKAGIPYIERSETGGQFIHFNDPDGNALYFIKPKY